MNQASINFHRNSVTDGFLAHFIARFYRIVCISLRTEHSSFCRGFFFGMNAMLAVLAYVGSFNNVMV